MCLSLSRTVCDRLTFCSLAVQSWRVFVVFFSAAVCCLLCNKVIRIENVKFIYFNVKHTKIKRNEKRIWWTTQQTYIVKSSRESVAPECGFDAATKIFHTFYLSLSVVVMWVCRWNSMSGRSSSFYRSIASIFLILIFRYLTICYCLFRDFGRDLLCVRNCQNDNPNCNFQYQKLRTPKNDN